MPSRSVPGAGGRPQIPRQRRSDAIPVGETIERFRFGVALHVGKILYGNIGGGNRLDFTCIGPAVNLAARLEKIASRLHRTVVASEGFAGICRGGWSDLGEFPIAGFSKAQRVYGLVDEVPGTEARRASAGLAAWRTRGRARRYSSGSVVNSSG